MGWATALSFDVLKRWLEKGEQPQAQYFRFFTYWALTFLFFFIWIYHGLIPKIVAMHPVEIKMFQQALSLSTMNAKTGLIILGLCEVAFGLLWLFFRNKRRLFFAQIILFLLLTTGVIAGDYSNLNHPFSPLTFNLALFTLSVIGLTISRDVPSTKHCRRRRLGVE